MMSPWQLFPISHRFPVCLQISVFYRLQLAGNMKGKPMHTHHKKVSLLKIGFLVLLVVISLQMRCKKSLLLIAKNHYLGTHYRVRVFGSGPQTPSQFFLGVPPPLPGPCPAFNCKQLGRVLNVQKLLPYFV